MNLEKIARKQMVLQGSKEHFHVLLQCYNMSVFTCYPRTFAWYNPRFTEFSGKI